MITKRDAEILKNDCLKTIGSILTVNLWASLNSFELAALTAFLKVSIVGSAALYIPALLTKLYLEYQGQSPNLNQAINASYILGSAALGAYLCGLAVQTYVLYAGIGMVLDTACNKLQGVPAVIDTVVSARLQGLFAKKPEYDNGDSSSDYSPAYN